MTLSFRTFLVILGLFLSLSLAIDAARGGRGKTGRLPAQWERLKTRGDQHNHEFASAELISVELDTTDESEARQILHGMNMELVRREGSLEDWYIATPMQGPGMKNKRDALEAFQYAAEQNDHVIFWENVLLYPTRVEMTPTDPLFPVQWNLAVNRSVSNQTNVVIGADIAMTTTWDLGYDGEGVHIQFVDDGLDTSHGEFTGRINASACHNWEGRNATVRSLADTHGTNCAGVSAGAMNNSLCGAGIAYRATISGIRWVGVPSTATTADALTGYARGVKVSSNSWGFVGGLGDFMRLGTASIDALRTLERGGTVTVFSAGNTGQFLGMCSQSELKSFPHSIIVAASSDRRVRSKYSAQCETVFVTAPSSDSNFPSSPRLRISTAETGGACTSGFTGTSAACPHVSGVVALMKQANPSLMLRDVQYILAQTSDRIDSTHTSWVQNAAGYWHSDIYGFGKIDPVAAIQAAKSWTPRRAAIYTPLTSQYFAAPQVAIPDSTGAVASGTINVALSTRIEHVGVYLKIAHDKPNQLDIRLVSPAGTEAVLSRPFLTQPAFSISGYTELTAFASPYYSYTTLPTSVSVSRVAYLSSCTAANIPSSTGANSALIIWGFNGDSFCSNPVTLIETAQTRGHTVVFFHGYADFVDLSGNAAQTNVIPSFWVPGWSSENFFTRSVFTLTRLTNDYQTRGEMANFFYFGSWKTFNESATGAWTVRVRDTAAGTAGTLQEWYIAFSYESPAPTAPVGSTTPPTRAPVSSTTPPTRAPVGSTTPPSTVTGAIPTAGTINPSPVPPSPTPQPTTSGSPTQGNTINSSAATSLNNLVRVLSATFALISVIFVSL